jgi:hypothetical protein
MCGVRRAPDAISFLLLDGVTIRPAQWRGICLLEWVVDPYGRGKAAGVSSISPGTRNSKRRDGRIILVGDATGLVIYKTTHFPGVF